MSFGDSLTKIRIEKGFSRKDLAEQLEIPYTTLRNYETDQREPGHKLLIKIANLLSVSVDELVGYQAKKENAPLYTSEALKLASDYDSHMDDRGRETVRAIADFEIARKKAQEQREQMEVGEMPEPDNVFYITNWFPLMPMSAGTGQTAGSDEPEELELKKRPPRGTSYIAPVSGDSMEPTYQDGDKLFIRSCKNIEVGQVGVFLMDGQQWVKELGNGVLISHNDKYAPIPMRDDIECQGLVLGVCDESYFECSTAGER